jgi:hypothetical protein
MEVTFRKTDVPTENGDDKREMDIVEISYPDGKVSAFPADMKSPETGIRYRDMFQGKYNAFKNGEPDPNRVAQLESEIAERQAELDGMRKAPDDKRVQENLGYDRDPKAGEDPNNATKPADGDPGRIDQPVVLGNAEPEPVNRTVPPVASPLEQTKPALANPAPAKPASVNNTKAPA